MGSLSGVEHRVPGNFNMNLMGGKRFTDTFSWVPCKLTIDDGSMESDSWCSFGWCVQGKGDQNRIAPNIAMGSGPVVSDPCLNSSTRSELFGLASALQFLQKFLKFHYNDTESILIIWRYSTTAFPRLEYLSWTLHPGRPPAKNADILSFLTHLPSECRCRVQIRWVKSHQDNTSGQSKLSIAVALNVKAEQLAS